MDERRSGIRSLIAIVVGLGLMTLVGGCSTNPAPTSEFNVAAGEYAKAFDAARDTLVAMRFELDRIDARAGIITTRPKSSHGLATPWDTEQSTLSQEWDDLMNHQFRRAEVRFEPMGTGVGTTDPVAQTVPVEGQGDLRESSLAMRGSVRIVVLRRHHTGARLEPESIRLSSRTTDPALRRRGIGTQYDVAVSEDRDLERRVAGAIIQGLDSGE